MAGHFTHRLYFHSPAREISRHTLTHVISIIYPNVSYIQEEEYTDHDSSTEW